MPSSKMQLSGAWLLPKRGMNVNLLSKGRHYKEELSSLRPEGRVRGRWPSGKGRKKRAATTQDGGKLKKGKRGGGGKNAVISPEKEEHPDAKERNIRAKT